MNFVFKMMNVCICNDVLCITITIAVATLRIYRCEAVGCRFFKPLGFMHTTQLLYGLRQRDPFRGQRGRRPVHDLRLLLRGAHRPRALPDTLLLRWLPLRTVPTGERSVKRACGLAMQ